VRASYCKEIVGFTTTKLHESLSDAERASTLGFDPQSVRSRQNHSRTNQTQYLTEPAS